MLRFKVFTLFPEIVDNYVEYNAPLKRGISNGVIAVEAVNFRDFSESRHRKVDDIVYGGGPGMVIAPGPVVKAVKAHQRSETRILIMDPRGRKMSNELARELAREEEIFLLCARYEGFDQRIYDVLQLEPVSLGDFVLTGGELPALAVMDATARFVPGSMDSYESQAEESFNFEGLLEYDQYTRPENFEGFQVPDVLRQGNHKKIEHWRLKKSLKNTIKNRPDLLKLLNLNPTKLDMVKIIVKELYGGH